jgi:hypothetical protein
MGLFMGRQRNRTVTVTHLLWPSSKTLGIQQALSNDYLAAEELASLSD